MDRSIRDPGTTPADSDRKVDNMNITRTKTRRSVVTAVALGAGLTLAACGGGDEETTSEVAPPPQEEAPEEEAPSAGGSETESDAGGLGETESDAALPPAEDSPTDEAGSAGPGAESESGAGEERIEFTVPAEWQDSSDMGELPEAGGVTEMHALVPSGDATGSSQIALSRFDASVTGGADSYLGMLEGTGVDTSAYTELEPRDIAGYEADGFDAETDLGTGPVRQQAYGFVLEDGSLVQVLLLAPVDEFETHQEDFEAVLDSIDIN